jgi:hypothetical protein
MVLSDESKETIVKTTAGIIGVAFALAIICECNSQEENWASQAHYSAYSAMR